MVQLKEGLVEEFETFKTITICCKFCEQNLADFQDVQSIKGYWKIDLMDLDYKAKFKIRNKYIICRCTETIGVSIGNSTYHLNKKFTKLIY